MVHKERTPEPAAAEQAARTAVPAPSPIQQPPAPTVTPVASVFSKADIVIRGSKAVLGTVIDIVLPPNADRFERRSQEFERTLQPFSSQFPEETRIATGLVNAGARLAREADAAEARGDAGRAQELRNSARSHYLEGIMKARSVPAIARRVGELERVDADPAYVEAQKASFNDYGLPSWQRAVVINEYADLRIKNDAAFDAGVPEGPMLAEVTRLGDGARRGLAFTDADYAQAMATFERLSEPVREFTAALQAGAGAFQQMIAAFGQSNRDFKAAMEKLDEELKKLLKKQEEGRATKEEMEKAKAIAEFATEAEKDLAGAKKADVPAMAGMLARGAVAALKEDMEAAKAQQELARAYSKAPPERKEHYERISRWLQEGRLAAADVKSMIDRESALARLESTFIGGKKAYTQEAGDIRKIDAQAAGLMKKADELREKAKLEKSPAKKKELEAQAAELQGKARQLLRTANEKTKGLVEIAKFEKDLREGGAPEPIINAVRAAYRFYGTASKWRTKVVLAAAKFYLENRGLLRTPQAAPILGALVKFLGIVSGPKKDSEIGGREKAESYLKKEIEPKVYLAESRITMDALGKAGAPKLLLDGMKAAVKFFGTKDAWRGKAVLKAAKFFLANQARLSSPQGKGALRGLLSLVVKAVKGEMDEADASGALGRLAMDTSQIPVPAAPAAKQEAKTAPARKPAASEAGAAREKAQERAGMLKGVRSSLTAFIDREVKSGASEAWANALAGFLGFVEETERQLEDPAAAVSEEEWERISECTTYIRGISRIVGGMPAENEVARKERSEASTLFGYAAMSMQEEGASEKTLALDFIAREYMKSDDPAYRARLIELGAGIADGSITLGQAKAMIAGWLGEEGVKSEAALRAADPQTADMFASLMPKGVAGGPESVTLEALGKARIALDFAKTVIGKVLPAIKKNPALREPALGIVRTGLDELGTGFADAAMEQAVLAAAYAGPEYKKERGAILALSGNVGTGVKVSRMHSLHLPADGSPGLSIEDAAEAVAGEGGDAAALVAAYGRQRDGAMADVRARRNEAFAQLGIAPERRDGYSKMLDAIHARAGDSADRAIVKGAILEAGGEENFEVLAGLYFMEYDAVDIGILGADKSSIQSTDTYFALGEGTEGLGKQRNPLPPSVRDAAAKGFGDLRAAVLRGDYIGEGWMSRIAVANGAVFGNMGGEEGIGAKLAGVKDKRQRKDAQAVYAAAIAELCAPEGRMEVGLAMIEAGGALAVTSDPADRRFILDSTSELQKPDGTLAPADYTERAYIIAKKSRALADIDANEKIPAANKSRAKADAAAYYDMAAYAHLHGRKQEAETIARAALLYEEALVQKYGEGDAKAANDTIQWVHAQLGDMSGVMAKSRRFLDAGWMPDASALTGEYARAVIGEPESAEATLARSTILRSETAAHSLALRKADSAGRLAKAKVAPEAVSAERKRLEGQARKESEGAARDRARAGRYLRMGGKYAKKAEAANRRAEEHDMRALGFARQSDALDKDWFDKRVADTQAYAGAAYGRVGRLEQEAVALEAAGDLEGADAKMQEAARLEETILAPLAGLETYASSIMDVKTPWKENGRAEARRGVDISLEVAAGHDVDETTGRVVEGPLSPQRAEELRVKAKADVAGGISLVAEQRAKQRQRYAGHRRIETGRKRAEIETLDAAEGARGGIDAARAEIEKAGAEGKGVGKADELHAQAEQAYAAGDYAEAYRLAYHAKQIAQGLGYAEDVAADEMADANAAVDKAKAAGKNMDDADAMLAKAQEAYQKRDYAGTFKWAGRARQYGEGVRKPAARPMPQTVKDPEALPLNVSVTYVCEEEIGTYEDGSPMIERVERTRTAFDRGRILHNYDRALDENDSYDFASSARFEKRAVDQLTVGRVALDVIRRDSVLVARRRAEMGAGKDGLVWVSKPDSTTNEVTTALFDPFSTDMANAAAFPAFEVADRDGVVVKYDPNRRAFSRDSYLGELFLASDSIEAGDAGAMGSVRAVESRYSTDFDLENIWIDIGAPRYKAFQLRARARPLTKGGLHITDPRQREKMGEGEAVMNDARADTLADQPAAKWLVRGMGEVADRYEDAANDAQTAWLAYTDHSTFVKAQGTYGDGLLAAISADLPPEVAAKIAGMDAAGAFEYLVQYNPGILIAALDNAETSGQEAAGAEGRLDFGDYSLRAWAYDLKSRAKSTETGWVEGHAETFWAPAEHSLQNGYQEFAHNDMLRASSLGRWRRTGSGVSKLEIGRTGAGWYALANAIAKDPMEFIRARDGTQTFKLEPTRVAYSNGDQWSTVGDFEGGYVVLPLLIAGLSFESAKHKAIITLGGTSLLEGSTVDWVHIFTEEGTRADEIRFTGEGHRGGIEEGGWGVEERAFYRSYEAARDSSYAVFGIQMYGGKERDAIARKRFEGWYADVASKRYADVLRGDGSGEFFSLYNAVADKFNSMPKPAFEAWFARYSSENPDTVKGRDYRSILQLGNEVLIPIRYKGQIPRMREEVEMGAGADFKSGFGYMEGPGEVPIAVAVNMDAEALGAARALADQVRMDGNFMLGEALGIEAYRKSYWTSAKNWVVDSAGRVVRPVGAPAPKRDAVATSESLFGAMEALLGSHSETARGFARGRIDTAGVYGHIAETRKITAPGGLLAKEAAKGREQRGVIAAVNFVEDLAVGVIMPSTFAASGIAGFFDQVDASGGYGYIGTRNDEKAFWKGMGLGDRWARYLVYGEAWANLGIAVFGGVSGPLGEAGAFSRTASLRMGKTMFWTGMGLGAVQAGRLVDWDAVGKGEFKLAEGVTAYDFGVAAANVLVSPIQDRALPHLLRGFGVGRPARNWMGSDAAIRRELRPSLGRRMLFWVGGIHGDNGIAAEAARNGAREALPAYERAAFDSLEARQDARIPAAEAAAMIETHTDARKTLVKKYGEEAVAGYSPDDGANPINIAAERARAKRQEAQGAGKEPGLDADEQAALGFAESLITAEAVARRKRPAEPGPAATEPAVVMDEAARLGLEAQYPDLAGFEVNAAAMMPEGPAKAEAIRAAKVAADYERYLLGARDMPQTEQQLFGRISRDNAKTEIAEFAAQEYGRNADAFDAELRARGLDPALLRDEPEYAKAVAKMCDAEATAPIIAADEAAEYAFRKEPGTVALEKLLDSRRITGPEREEVLREYRKMKGMEPVPLADAEAFIAKSDEVAARAARKAREGMDPLIAEAEALADVVLGAKRAQETRGPRISPAEIARAARPGDMVAADLLLAVMRERAARSGEDAWTVGGREADLGTLLRTIEDSALTLANGGRESDVLIFSGDKVGLNTINGLLGHGWGDVGIAAYREIVRIAMLDAAGEGGSAYFMRPGTSDETTTILIVPAGKGGEVRAKVRAAIERATEFVLSSPDSPFAGDIARIGHLVLDPRRLVAASGEISRPIQVRKGPDGRISASYPDGTTAFITRPDGRSEFLTHAVTATDDPAFAPGLRKSLLVAPEPNRNPAILNQEIAAVNEAWGRRGAPRTDAEGAMIRRAEAVLRQNGVEPDRATPIQLREAVLAVARERTVMGDAETVGVPSVAFEIRLSVADGGVLGGVRGFLPLAGKAVAEVLANSFGIRALNTFLGHDGANAAINLFDTLVAQYAHGHGFRVREIGTLKYVIEGGTPEQVMLMYDFINRQIEGMPEGSRIGFRINAKSPVVSLDAGTSGAAARTRVSNGHLAIERRGPERKLPPGWTDEQAKATDWDGETQRYSDANALISAFHSKMATEPFLRMLLGDQYDTLLPIIRIIRSKSEIIGSGSIRNFEDLVFALRDPRIGGENGRALEGAFRSFIVEHGAGFRARLRDSIPKAPRVLLKSGQLEEEAELRLAAGMEAPLRRQEAGTAAARGAPALRLVPREGGKGVGATTAAEGRENATAPDRDNRTGNPPEDTGLKPENAAAGAGGQTPEAAEYAELLATSPFRLSLLVGGLARKDPAAMKDFKRLGNHPARKHVESLLNDSAIKKAVLEGGLPDLEIIRAYSKAILGELDAAKSRAIPSEGAGVLLNISDPEISGFFGKAASGDSAAVSALVEWYFGMERPATAFDALVLREIGIEARRMEIPRGEAARAVVGALISHPAGEEIYAVATRLDGNAYGAPTPAAIALAYLITHEADRFAAGGNGYFREPFIEGLVALSSKSPAGRLAPAIESYCAAARGISERLPQSNIRDSMLDSATGKVFRLSAMMAAEGMDAPAALLSNGRDGLLDIFPPTNRAALTVLGDAADMAASEMGRIPQTVPLRIQAKGKMVDLDVPRAEIAGALLHWLFKDVARFREPGAREVYLRRFDAQFTWDGFSPHYRMLMIRAAKSGKSVGGIDKLPILTYAVSDQSGTIPHDLIIKTLDSDFFRARLGPDANFQAFASFVGNIHSAGKEINKQSKRWLEAARESLEFLNPDEAGRKKAGIGEKLKDSRKYFLESKMAYLNELLFRHREREIDARALAYLAEGVVGKPAKADFEKALAEGYLDVFGNDMGLDDNYVISHTGLYLEVSAYRKNLRGFSGEPTPQMGDLYIGDLDAFGKTIPILDEALLAESEGRFSGFKFSNEFRNELRESFGPVHGTAADEAFGQWSSDERSTVLAQGKTFVVEEASGFEELFHAGVYKGETACQNPRNGSFVVAGLVGMVELPWMKEVIVSEANGAHGAYKRWIVMVKDSGTGTPILLVQPGYGQIEARPHVDKAIIGMLKAKYEPLGIEVRDIPKPEIRERKHARNYGYRTFRSGRSPFFYLDSNMYSFPKLAGVAQMHGLHQRESGRESVFDRGWEKTHRRKW